MIDVIAHAIVQVAATLLLGVFFGMERQLKGWPRARGAHANAAVAGLLGMLAFNPGFYSLALTMAVAMAMSFAVVGLTRSTLQMIAGDAELFAATGADVFSLGSAISAGCACGTSDVRAVAGVVMVMTCVAIFKADQRRPFDVLQQGDVDPREQV